MIRTKRCPPIENRRIAMSDDETLVEEPVSADVQFTARASEAVIATRQSGTLATTKDDQTATMRTETTALVDLSSNEKTTNVTVQGAEIQVRKLLWVAVPSIASAVLSLMIWTAQSKVQQRMDENSKYLSTQLSLTQDLYKKKLAAYEETYHNVAFLVEALSHAKTSVQSKTQAMDRLQALQVSYRQNKLYMSDPLYKGLDDLWDTGASLEVLRTDAEESGNDGLVELYSKAKFVENLMKKDLYMEEMDQAILAINSKPAN
jgi:hypothetical protein